MALQNRVDPLGRLHAVPHRGTYTGNRGVIHNSDKKIVRQYANKRWIYCKLKFKHHHRDVMTPNRWTELFFLDDATALSAGHRPCAYCQREKYNRFMAAWREGNSAGHLSLNEVDARMHEERRNRISKIYAMSDLPDGVMVRYLDQIYLKREGLLHKWSFEGYRNKIY